MSQQDPGGSTVPSHNSPTLLIGLGGLGREVIFRTRRRLYERYRRTELPFVDYLWLDEDISTDPIPELPTRIAGKVALPVERRVSLALDPPDALEFTRRQADSGHEEYASFAEILKRSPSFPRSRLLGRLALEHKSGEATQKLRAALAAISSDTARESSRALGFEVATDSAPQVILICSLAGGIGSGALLAMAQIVRRECPDAHVRGILFLSGLFMAHDVRRRRIAMSNGYAACRELTADQERAERPLVDLLYLIDRENAAGSRPIDPLEPLEMVAETLTLEFSRSEMAAALRRERYRLPRARGFRSFGLAGVAPGGGRLRSAAAYLLGAELLDFFAAPEARPAPSDCGFEGPWPTEKISAAARDIREEFETYDIPPVEERNEEISTAYDLRKLLYEHLRTELNLPASAQTIKVIEELATRLPRFIATAPVAGAEPSDPVELFLDRLEQFCLNACSHLDRRVVESGPIVDHATLARMLESLCAWSEPWAPIAPPLQKGEERSLVGGGLPREVPMLLSLDAPLFAHHPGSISLYRESASLPPSRYNTFAACRREYLEFSAEEPASSAHRHTVARPDDLPDPLVEAPRDSADTPAT